MSLFNTGHKLTIHKDWDVYKGYIAHTDLFDDVNKQLPVIFYNATYGNNICPIVKKDKVVEVIFTSGAKEAETKFRKQHSSKSLVDLEDGTYLYDYENDTIIYKYDGTKLMGDVDTWKMLPPDDAKFVNQHLVGVDRLGKVHRVYHKTVSFADACFLGHLINITFAPGDYKPNNVGTRTIFAILAKRYALSVPSPRMITSFLESSFDPQGLTYPTYTVSTALMDLVFKQENKPARQDWRSTLDDDWGYEDYQTEQMGLFGMDQRTWNRIMAENLVSGSDSLITLHDLIGNANPPTPEEDVVVHKSMQVVGVSKVILTKAGKIFVYYDKRVTSVDQIIETLELAHALTFYIDTSKEGIQ